MEWNTIISVMFGTIVAVGAIFFLYQLHNIIVIDAKTRGLKHSRFWGLLQLGNNTGEGLLVYLIRRRNCPVINITENDRQEISKRKKNNRHWTFVCLSGNNWNTHMSNVVIKTDKRRLKYGIMY